MPASDKTTNILTTPPTSYQPLTGPVEVSPEIAALQPHAYWTMAAIATPINMLTVPTGVHLALPCHDYFNNSHVLVRKRL